MNKAAACQVIVCAGDRVNPDCARVIADFGNQYHFVMKEWLSENHLCRTALLWVVDSSTPCDDLYPALREGIPLLVPEQNPELTHLCISARCGIWYRDETDARLCLNYVLASDTIREHLGAGGQAYFASRNLQDSRSARAFAAAAR